ncbi:MAG: peptidoglycan/LPS O-acetylase OafA/YrhL [Desulforhopalus sp.]|jgi:peptidoglycan/LPS O-acetylase OafA/YrhL
MTTDSAKSNSETKRLPSQRLTDVDIAKGLAIILVVFGHIVARQPPAENGWYLVVKEAIYGFHMAFFMFLSGIVFFMKVRIVKSWKDYKDELWKRFIRLMPAYLLFAGAVFLAKWGAQSFLYVDNPVNGWTDFVNILLFPTESISAFLWYIYVLFLFSTVGISLIPLTRGAVLPLVGLGLILLFVTQTPFLGMDQFCKYFLFFALGGLAIRHWEKYNTLVYWTWIPAMVVFIVMLVTGQYRGDGWIPTALLSLIALHGLCKQQIPFTNILSFLGLMSFPIYLMNTLSIGFVKALMLKFISWDGTNFLLFSPILTIAGLFIPVLVKQHLIRRVDWLNKITS